MGEEGECLRGDAHKVTGVQGFHLVDVEHPPEATKLNSDSDLRAAENQKELSENVTALLESNQSLSRRLMNLEDAFEVRTIVTKRQSRAFSTTNGINDDTPNPQQLNESTERAGINRSHDISQLSTSLEGIAVSSFDFEEDLEASRVYRRAQRDTMDFSFRSSIAYTNAWSVFSTLSDVSIISAIALPLYPEEIENAHHYRLGEPLAMPAIEPMPYTAPRVRPLYQQCLEVELRLAQIPGFPEIFAMLRDESEEDDPLTFLIRVFRRGVPLLMLLERVSGIRNPNNLIQLGDHIDPQKMPKVATYKFVKTCIDDLSFQPKECFLLSDLFGDDSTGFIKVVKVVTRLLDTLTSSGDIEPVDLATSLPDEDRRLTDPSPRDIIVEGFLVDERTYVADLERLLEFKRKIGIDGSLRNDILNPILTGLDPIVDGQRMFLLAMEKTARKPADQQMWAVHFEDWSLMSRLYANFITSEKEAREYIRTVIATQLRVQNDDLSSVLRDSLRLLYLPSQRLPKYSGFLQELRRQGGISRTQSLDLSGGIKALQSALGDINTAIKRQELQEARADLVARVKDWKGHNIELYGDLLLFDFVSVVAGSKSDVAKTYRAYLYEKMLFFFKDPSPPRKSIFRRAKKTEPDAATNTYLKGRIHAKHFADIVALAKSGSYTCQIWWKGEPGLGVQNIIMRFPTESKMKTWCQELQEAREMNAESPAGSPSAADSFDWMRDQTQQMPNPYAAVTDDEDTDDEESHEAPPTVLRPLPRFPMRAPAVHGDAPEGNWL